MSSLMLVPKDQSIISESFRDMLSEFERRKYIRIDILQVYLRLIYFFFTLVPRKATRPLPSEKKSRRESKKVYVIKENHRSYDYK